MMNKISETFARSIGWKIALSVGIVSTIGIGMFVFVAYLTGSAILEEERLDRAIGVTAFGEAVLEHVMMEGNAAHLKQALTAVASAEGVDEIMIVNPQGRVFVDSQGGPHTNPIDFSLYAEVPDRPGIKSRDVRIGGVESKRVMVPIRRRPGCVNCHQNSSAIMGYLIASVPVGGGPTVSEHHRFGNLMLTLALAIGIIGLNFVVTYWLVVRPLRRVRSRIVVTQAQVEDLRAGKLVSLTPIGTDGRRDEIGDMVGSFNALLGKLNEAHETIDRAHHAQMVHADRLSRVGEVAAGLAHEMKNPLAGVLGALEVLIRRADEQSRSIMHEALEQLRRIERSLKELLEYARPEDMRFDVHDLQRIVMKVVSLVRFKADQAGVRIHVVCEVQRPMVRADATMLEQVFWNIILNAIEAMEHGGTVSIVTMARMDAWVVEVTDSGPGIPEDQRKHLFDSFHSTKPTGTGLGLPISARIMEQHGGELRISSIEGRGTTVSVILPHRESEG